jgi:ATP-dependent Lhr-like helicase
MFRTFYGPERERSVCVQTLAGVPLRQEEFNVSKEETEDGEGLIGQWLQFYGPVTLEFIRETLGIDSERLQLIIGELVTEGGSDEVCDSENFEMLLRLVRIEARPAFEPLGIEWLPLFLADYQGVISPSDRIDGIDGLSRCVEQLLCYPAEAGTWESEIFPARLHPYDPSWLDTLMQEGGLLWIGSEGHRVTFCFESELDLFQEEPEKIELTSDHEYPSRLISWPGAALPPDLFSDPAGRYDFSTLLRLSKNGSAELAQRLWDEVWKGRVTNDTFISLRRALMNRFRISERVSEDSRKGDRRESRFRRLSLMERKEGSSYPGSWHLVPKSEIPEDLLEREELRKDRARLLLDRYGILFRELLQREWPALRWSNVFRALRIMELSGEVIAGIFFHGIPGPQFTSQKAFRRLQRKLPDDAIYWINATDPASLCGTQLESVRGMLPARVATTHLVYRGSRLIVVSKRNGKDLIIHVAPDDPNLPEYMVVLRHLLTRKFQPMKRISIGTINGESASQSPYLPALRAFSDVAVDYKNVTLYRKIR